MFEPKTLNVAMALALSVGAASAVNAEIEISGHVKNETAWVIDNDQFIGEERTALDKSSHHGDTLKFENSARVFVNGEFGEESSWHLDLNLVYDSEGVESEYKGHESYTQNDWLREAYIDTRWGDTDIRIGKQQVVWGTADGIKLLDIINPTDYREYSQNTMEDSRIPIWMVNVDTPIGETGSLQFIVSEHEENKIPGLDKDGDPDHPYTMKGVDTITGEVNGFLNIIPNLTGVATSFTMGAAGGMFGASPSGLVPFSSMSVDTFASLPWAMGGGGVLAPSGLPVAPGSTDNVQNFPGFAGNGFVMLNAIAQQGLPTLMGMPGPDPYGNHSVTSLMSESGTQWDMTAPTTSTVGWNIQNPKSAFEYMPNASFATFNNSAGNLWMVGGVPTPGFHGPAQSEYVRDYPDDTDVNFGFRYKDSTDNGLNYSFNYFYNYDSNPSIGLSCVDSTTGEELGHELRRPTALGVPNFGGANSTVITTDQVSNAYDGTMGVAYRTVPTTVSPTGKQYYGAYNPMTGGLSAFGDATHSPNGITMRFTETLDRVHNFGGSFDMSVDRFAAPLVIRGEFLYKKDEMHPVIDKRLLGIGYLPEALVSEEHDMFKYVIGADVTVMTNLLISGQFIQFRNLDFQDDKRTCTTQFGTTFDCSRYTGDMPTLSLDNDLQKAEENKEFISLFFSKPFGSDQQGRWNNITIFEDTGGYWNRFDVEYGFTDQIVGSVELNSYWGDEDSWFGQLKETSNIQVGVKYIFE